MAELADELEVLGGGGRLGAALRASRYWPAAACGLAVPGVLTGNLPAVGVLLSGAAGVVLTARAEKALKAAP